MYRIVHIRQKKLGDKYARELRVVGIYCYPGNLLSMLLFRQSICPSVCPKIFIGLTQFRVMLSGSPFSVKLLSSNGDFVVSKSNIVIIVYLFPMRV